MVWGRGVRQAEVMSTTGVTTALPARRSGRSTPVMMLLLCVGLLTTMQAFAIGERNPINDTLSSYVYVSGGWMFGAALVVLAVGMVEVSRQLRHRGAGGMTVRLILCGAAFSSVLAAFFQADPGDAESASAIGEIHKWGSIGLLALAGLGAVLTVLFGLLDRRAARAVSVLLALSAVSGVAFLGGQVSKWSLGGSAALADQAPWAGGLSQRILVLCLVCALIVISDALTVRAGDPAVEASTSAVPVGTLLTGTVLTGTGTGTGTAPGGQPAPATAGA